MLGRGICRSAEAVIFFDTDEKIAALDKAHVDQENDIVPIDDKDDGADIEVKDIGAGGKLEGGDGLGHEPEGHLSIKGTVVEEPILEGKTANIGRGEIIDPFVETDGVELADMFMGKIGDFAGFFLEFRKDSPILGVGTAEYFYSDMAIKDLVNGGIGDVDIALINFFENDEITEMIARLEVANIWSRHFLN